MSSTVLLLIACTIGYAMLVVMAIKFEGYNYRVFIRDGIVFEDLGGYEDEEEKVEAGEAKVIRDYIASNNIQPKRNGEIHAGGRELYDLVIAHRRMK